MKKQRSQIEIDEMHRLEQMGVPVDWRQFYTPFQLTFFPISWWEIDTEPLDSYIKRLGELIIAAEFECELEGIHITLKLLSPEVPTAPDSISWRRKTLRYKMSRTLDFEGWKLLKPSEKTKLVAETVIGLFEGIPTARLSGPKKMALIGFAREAMRKKRAPAAKARSRLAI